MLYKAREAEYNKNRNRIKMLTPNNKKKEKRNENFYCAAERRGKPEPCRGKLNFLPRKIVGSNQGCKRLTG